MVYLLEEEKKCLYKPLIDTFLSKYFYSVFQNKI